MESIPLPSKIEIAESKKDWARFIIEPCYPGYGTTLGNSIRRVLLSSLPGSAVTAVKIEGADHEFSTLPYVKEDVVAILLNLKLLRFKLHTDEPVTLTLTAKGEKLVTAADFEGPSTVEVVSGKLPVATLTDKAGSLSMEITVNTGRGYAPVESREKEKLDIGWIAVDSVYTPMKTVNFSVESVRVGQITNFDRLILEVEKDGSIKPEEAVATSAKILVDHFNEFLKLSENVKGTAPEETPRKKRAKSKKSGAADADEKEADTIVAKEKNDETPE